MPYESKPSISLNKLGEYIYGSEAKKRSILKTLKFPSTFINARYSSPKSAIMHFLLDEKHDLTILHSKRQQIVQKNTSSPWQKNNQQCCIQALDDLIISTNTILAPYLNFRSQRGLPRELSIKDINGVLVHVNPDIILFDKAGKSPVGAIRLIFSKSRIIETDEGQVIASLIKDHVEKVYSITLKSSNCIAVDVFHRRSIPARSEYKSVQTKVNKACAEIIQLWPGIQ